MKGVFDRRFLAAGLVAVRGAFVAGIMTADHVHAVPAVAVVYAHARDVGRNKRRKEISRMKDIVLRVGSLYRSLKQ
jgi:hypothetical protein